MTTTRATQGKPTPGPWRCEFQHQVGHTPVKMYWLNDLTSCGTSVEADAQLCAEAGTVYHETGLTPRQLADQRAELLAALEAAAIALDHSAVRASCAPNDDEELASQEFTRIMQTACSAWKEARAAIARAKDGTP